MLQTPERVVATASHAHHNVPAHVGDTATGRDLLGALLVSVGFFTLYRVFRQDGYFSDGRFLIESVNAGEWWRHHVLYLPVGHFFRWLFQGWLGRDAEPSLHLLSSIPAAVAVGVTFLAGRRMGCGFAAALLASVLMGTSCSYWFFSTCVEVHGLHLLFAAVALLVATARGPGDAASALTTSLLLFGLIGSHLSGVLWIPAAVLWAFRKDRGWETPRNVGIAALFLLLASIGAWVALDGFASLTRRSWQIVTSSWTVENFLATIVWPAPLLVSAGVASGASLAMADRGAWRRPLGLATTALFLTALPFAFTMREGALGAYYVSLLPVLALTVGWAVHRGRVFQRLPRGALAIGVALVAANLTLSLRQVNEWEHRYAGVEWATRLFDEAEGSDLVLTRHGWESHTILRHSRLSTACWENATKRFDQLAEPVLWSRISKNEKGGGALWMTRAFRESKEPAVAELVQRLVQRYGEPRPGKGSDYWGFDVGASRGAPASATTPAGVLHQTKSPKSKIATTNRIGDR